MCGFCGARGARDGSTAVAREQFARAATHALVPARITVRAWSGQFVVATATGRSLIVDRIVDVAGAAAMLSGRTRAELSALLHR